MQSVKKNIWTKVVAHLPIRYSQVHKYLDKDTIFSISALYNTTVDFKWNRLDVLEVKKSAWGCLHTNQVNGGGIMTGWYLIERHFRSMRFRTCDGLRVALFFRTCMTAIAVIIETMNCAVISKMMPSAQTQIPSLNTKKTKKHLNRVWVL